MRYKVYLQLYSGHTILVGYYSNKAAAAAASVGPWEEHVVEWRKGVFGVFEVTSGHVVEQRPIPMIVPCNNTYINTPYTGEIPFNERKYGH